MNGSLNNPSVIVMDKTREREVHAAFFHKEVLAWLENEDSDARSAREQVKYFAKDFGVTEREAAELMTEGLDEILSGEERIAAEREAARVARAESPADA